MGTLLRSWGLVVSCILLTTAIAHAGDEVEAVNALLDRMERAWETHDIQALDRCLSSKNCLAILSRPEDPEGAWVGGKDAALAQIGQSWSAVVRQEYVEREISVNQGAAIMRLAVADKLANGQRRLVRVWDKGTPGDIQAKLKELESRHARGLVLDLRGCNGGIPQATQAVAELFLPTDKALWGVQLDGEPIQKATTTQKTPTRIPMAVLIGKDTVSAGMLLAYAIKENGRP